MNRLLVFYKKIGIKLLGELKWMVGGKPFPLLQMECVK